MARVLVVEDEARIAGLIAKGLRAAGHEVLVAEDGELGLFLAAADDVDAVILDLGLPGRDGVEVLGALQVLRPAIPVIVLTGYDDPEHRAICLASGAAAYETKPFSTRMLVERVDQLAMAARR